MKINLYTDGSAKGNPGRGGYGLVLISGKHYKEISQGFRHTTNNRMELLAVIVGLEHLKSKECDVLVFSDSKYVVDSVEKKWVFQWVKKGFKGKKNADLWKRFLLIYLKHNVSFQWVEVSRTNILFCLVGLGIYNKEKHFIINKVRNYNQFLDC